MPPPVFTSLKITGIDVFSAGVLAAADEGDDEITLHDAARGIYKKLILRGDRIVGSVLYGEVARRPVVRRADARARSMCPPFATSWSLAAHTPSGSRPADFSIRGPQGERPHASAA